MGIISWILLGLVAGALAKLLMPGRDPRGCLVTIVLGIVGAVVGGMIGSYLGWGRVDSFDLRGILIATLGAFVLLILWRLISRR